MSFDFSFLDLFWRLLLSLLSLSTSVLLLTAAGYLFLKMRISKQQLKSYLNFHLLILVFVLIGATLATAFFDKEIALKCFQQFSEKSQTIAVTRVLAGVWLSAIIFLVSFDIYSWFRIRTGVSKLLQVTDQDILTLLNLLKVKMKVEGPIQLKVAELGSSPFVFGFFDHSIVVPRSVLKSLSMQSLENILAHELAHIREYDLVWQFLDLLCQRILICHPLMSFVSKRRTAIFEMTADAAAIDCLERRAKNYLNSLVEVLDLSHQEKTSPLVISASRSFEEVQQRIAALANTKSKAWTQFKFRLVFLMSALLCMVVSFAQAEKNIFKKSLIQSDEPLMCSQMNHEIMIEKWLKIETQVPNKCE